jgi:hypothetical protein
MADQEKRGRGRPPGALNKRREHNEKMVRKISAAEKRADKVVEKTIEEGELPADFPDLPLDAMIYCMHKFAKRRDWRNVLIAAEKAAPYIHAKKQSVEITGDMQNPLAVATVSLDKHEYQEIARRLLDEV